MEVRKACVVGAGVMGSGIAEVFLRAQVAVRLVDTNREALEEARRRITASLNSGGLQEDAFSTSDNLDVSDCDFAIEAVYEERTAKEEVLSQLGKVLGPEIVIATNTSALSVTTLGEASGRPDRFCGMHFMNPAPAMKLVEVVRGERTSDETIAAVNDLAKKLGKRPVVVGDSPGFVVNRLLIPMVNEAAELLRLGVAPKEAIDAAMRFGANHPLGPLALGDIIGLDVIKSIMETLSAGVSGQRGLSPLIEEMVGRGLLGKKSGEGFYKYPGRKGK